MLPGAAVICDAPARSLRRRTVEFRERGQICRVISPGLTSKRPRRIVARQDSIAVAICATESTLGASRISDPWAVS